MVYLKDSQYLSGFMNFLDPSIQWAFVRGINIFEINLKNADEIRCFPRKDKSKASDGSQTY